MLETRAKVFFRVRESNLFIRESFAKVGHCPHSVMGCHPLPPGSGMRRAPENFGLVLVQLPVWWLHR